MNQLTGFPAQAFANDLQDTVTEIMAIGIVDQLEAVQIKVDQGKCAGILCTDPFFENREKMRLSSVMVRVLAFQTLM